MSNKKKITPAVISRIIRDEEIPLRCRTFSPETTEKIFRYGAIVGSRVRHYHQLDRGMDLARHLICKAEKVNRSFHSGTAILADELGMGKGRFKRYWHAPKGGIWLTLILANTLLPESSLLIPMAAGVACCETLRDLGIKASIKWVNDVLVNGRKISGILSETYRGPLYREEYILIGIGINVNNNMFPDEFSEQATSVKSCLKKECSLQEITIRLLAKLRWYIGLLYHEEARLLEVHGGIRQNSECLFENMSPDKHLLLETYRSLSDITNRRVLFGFNVQEAPQFEATVIGLDSSGGLLLELDDGSRTVQRSGEIIYLD